METLSYGRHSVQNYFVMVQLVQSIETQMSLVM